METPEEVSIEMVLIDYVELDTFLYTLDQVIEVDDAVLLFLDVFDYRAFQEPHLDATHHRNKLGTTLVTYIFVHEPDRTSSDVVVFQEHGDMHCTKGRLGIDLLVFACYRNHRVDCSWVSFGKFVEVVDYSLHCNFFIDAHLVSLKANRGIFNRQDHQNVNPATVVLLHSLEDPLLPLR